MKTPSTKPPRNPQHAVSRASDAAPGQDSGTTQSSEWLAEREVKSAPADEARRGITIDDDPRPAPGRTARESRRGSHQSG